jgi:hypothetical protein
VSHRLSDADGVQDGGGDLFGAHPFGVEGLSSRDLRQQLTEPLMSGAMKLRLARPSAAGVGWGSCQGDGDGRVDDHPVHGCGFGQRFEERGLLAGCVDRSHGDHDVPAVCIHFPTKAPWAWCAANHSPVAAAPGPATMAATSSTSTSTADWPSAARASAISDATVFFPAAMGAGDHHEVCHLSTMAPLMMTR